MDNKKIEYGLYNNRIPYLIRRGSGEPSIIVFEPSRELIKSLVYRADSIVKTYNKILPSNCSLCVLGYDPGMPEKYTDEEIAGDFAEIIEKKFKPGIVIGISYGGAVAIPFAALHPKFTTKLVLLVSAYAASPKGVELMKEFMELIKDDNTYKALQKFNSLYLSWFYRTVSTLLTFLKRRSILLHKNPPSTFINSYTRIMNSNGSNKKYLPSIDVPALIIGGDRDQFFSGELFEETAKLIPKGKAVVLKNGGHYVILEKLKEVKKILNDFIESDQPVEKKV